MRLRNKPWAADYITSHPNVVEKSPADWKGKWQKKFSREENPLHVEVGTGKGRFLTRMAAVCPDVNYIGIEKYESVLVTGVQRVVEEDVGGVFFLQEDVEHLTDFFGDGEVERIYINFTDPWPKNKHAKRRLTHSHFLKKYKQVLAENGEIHFKTDNQGLFEYSIESLSAAGFKLKNISLNLHEGSVENNVMTEYEDKFARKGLRIYRLEAELQN